MKRLPGILLKRRAAGSAMAVLWWNALRGMRLISHRSLKWRLTNTARRHLEQEDWDDLAEQLARTLNPKVASYIQSRRDLGCLTYIATAAMEEYTIPLCRILGYDGVLATRFTEDLSDYEELSRHAKHEAIENLLQERQLRLESFLTDHTDDLPTAKAFPNLTILVGGAPKTVKEFNQSGITRYLS